MVLLARTTVASESSNPEGEVGQSLGDAEGTPSVQLSCLHLASVPGTILRKGSASALTRARTHAVAIVLLDRGTQKSTLQMVSS